MKALIFDNKVVQIEATEFEVHSSLNWVDCDSSVEVGFVYDGTTFTNPQVVLSAEDNLDRLRARRNVKLQETDWWASSDLTMTPEQTTYRQALRDITNTYTSLDDVVWPTKP